MNNLPNMPKRIIIEIKFTTLALCNGPNYENNALEFDLNISFILWEMIYFLWSSVMHVVICFIMCP